MTYYIQKSNFVKNLLKLQYESDRSWFTGLQSLETSWTFFGLLIFMFFSIFRVSVIFIQNQEIFWDRKTLGGLKFFITGIFSNSVSKNFGVDLFWGQINFWSRNFFSIFCSNFFFSILGSKMFFTIFGSKFFFNIWLENFFFQFGSKILNNLKIFWVYNFLMGVFFDLTSKNIF